MTKKQTRLLACGSKVIERYASTHNAPRRLGTVTDINGDYFTVAWANPLLTPTTYNRTVPSQISNLSASAPVAPVKKKGPSP